MTIVFGSRKPRRNGSRSKDYLTGFGSIFNLSGNTDREYPADAFSEEADRLALENDWKAIGQDLSAAVQSYSKRV
ncbi:hypothetical protein [Curtobacterium flaccumfaciens]|uniref:hypothetical protein n=1 Tax=Curtobacterium flaccumfaciens TaxID=2035 RepID=UPI003993D1D5